MAKQTSPYLGTWKPKDTIGRGIYDPQQIYRYLFDNSDRYGIILYTQSELAESIKIQRETMQYFYQDFMSMGWFEKEGRNTFRMLFSPDDIEWDEQTYIKIWDLHKRHQTKYRKKMNEKENMYE